MNLNLVNFESIDGFLLPGLFYEPQEKTKKVALFLHGSVSSIFYNVDLLNSLGSALTNHGISFFPFNNRGAHWIRRLTKTTNGIKEKVQIGTTFELVKECLFDIDGALEFLRQHGYEEFYLIGHSTGANKICVYHYYKPDNPISSYVLLAGGDDTGMYYQQAGKERFKELLKEAEQKINDDLGRTLVPKAPFDAVISYQSLYDTINPNGDYNVFPFFEYITKTKLSDKTLFRHYKSLNKPTLALYGSEDEYFSEPIDTILTILQQEHSFPELFTGKVIQGSNHSFDGKEQDVAEAVATWLTSS